MYHTKTPYVKYFVALLYKLPLVYKKSQIVSHNAGVGVSKYWNEACKQEVRTKVQRVFTIAPPVNAIGKYKGYVMYKNESKKVETRSTGTSL